MTRFTYVAPRSCRACNNSFKPKKAFHKHCDKCQTEIMQSQKVSVQACKDCGISFEPKEAFHKRCDECQTKLVKGQSFVVKMCSDCCMSFKSRARSAKKCTACSVQTGEGDCIGCGGINETANPQCGVCYKACLERPVTCVICKKWFFRHFAYEEQCATCCLQKMYYSTALY